MTKLSIIIPAYNEEKRIKNTLYEYCRYFAKKGIEFEIVVVLNACKDDTSKIVRQCQKQFKEIKLLDFEKGGKGFAIIEGFKDALKRRNDLIGFIDADMATCPKAFWDLIESIRKHDGVIASRWIKGSVVKTKQTLSRRFASRIFNLIVRSLFFFQHRDTQCGAKLFKRNTLEKIVPYLKLTEWAFDVNLLYLCKKEGLRVKEIPTIWEDKSDSKISNVPKTSLQMFLGVLRLRGINSPFVRTQIFFRPLIGLAWRLIK